MKNVKLKYGIKDDQVVHISEVESGLACLCVCSSCGELLIAKKGSKRESHFAHKSGSSCDYAVESALHFAAKEILDKSKEIMLPAVWLDLNTNRSGYKIASERLFPIDEVQLEQTAGGVIPDVIATIGGRKLFVEIFVTHKIDDDKKRKLEQLGHSTIEIDLSKAPRDMNAQDLHKLVVESVDNKTWIYNARTGAEYQRMLSQTRSMPITSRGCAQHVDFCPTRVRIWKGRPYANLIDDCIYCERCIEISDDGIMCNGHLPVHQVYIPKSC